MWRDLKLRPALRLKGSMEACGQSRYESPNQRYPSTSTQSTGCQLGCQILQEFVCTILPQWPNWNFFHSLSATCQNKTGSDNALLKLTKMSRRFLFLRQIITKQPYITLLDCRDYWKWPRLIKLATINSYLRRRISNVGVGLHIPLSAVST